jgi:DNA polymerase alpha subunit A
LTNFFSRLSEEGHPTDVTPSQQDVFSDFDAVRRQAGVKAWRAKFVKRKYAFGQEGVREGESEWLKVVYGFNGMFYSYR